MAGSAPFDGETPPVKLVFADVEALARAVAARFREAASAAIATRGVFRCALTGGSAARAVYGRIAQESIDWRAVHLYWGDERMVPPDDPESNYRLARAELLSRIPIPAGNVHRIRGEEAEARRAAAAYEGELRRDAPDGLDLVHLGVGPDGHVCSLFPGHRALAESRRWAAAVLDAPKPPSRRVTLTLPALAAARELWFLVLGAEKARAVREAIEEPHSALPAALAARAAARSTWFLDAPAAALLRAAP